MTTPAVSKLYLWQDSNARQTFAIDFPTYTNNYALGTTAKTVTFPAGANFALLSCTGNFYICVNGTAVIPTTDITDGSGSSLNPTSRHVVSGVNSFSVIAPSSCILSVDFYS